MNDKSAPPAKAANEPEGDKRAPAAFTKTPMFQVANAARYQRQSLIKEIEAITHRKLVCYVAGIDAPIERDDSIGFVELLHNIQKGGDLDLLLHTPGGNLDAAEKLINQLHATVGVGSLRVVVPDFAKSSGTLMALGASAIVMSDSSELGPIDPQVKLDDGRGNLINHSVLHYLDAYKTYSEALRRNPSDVTATIMLSKLDPATVELYQGVKDRAKNIAEEQLNRWMFQSKKGNYTKIAADLLDINKYPSHGQMIDWQDATQMELQVEYLPPDGPLWRNYWQLYCLQRYAITDRGKLFESDCASYAVEGV